MAKPTQTEQTDYFSDDSEEIIENESDDEYDDNEYCICRGKDDGTFMICCDACNEWYHGRCVHITARKAKELDKWICDFCIKKVPKPWLKSGSTKESFPSRTGTSSTFPDPRNPSRPAVTQQTLPMTSVQTQVATPLAAVPKGPFSSTEDSRKRSLPQSYTPTPEPAPKKTKPNTSPESQSRKVLTTSGNRPPVSTPTEAERIKKMREQASNLLFGVLDKMYKDALLAQEQKKTRIATSGTDKKETQPLVSEDKSEDSKLTETTTTTPTEQPKTDAPQPKETQPTQMQSQSQPKNQTSSTESKTEQSDEIPTSVDVRALVTAIEEEMWRYATTQASSTLVGSGSGGVTNIDAYREKFRILMSNLPRNVELCHNILKSVITPQQLIAMDSVQLATRELLNYRQQRERYLPVKEPEPVSVPLVKPSLTTDTEILIAATTAASSPPHSTTTATTANTSSSTSTSTSTSSTLASSPASSKNSISSTKPQNDIASGTPTTSHSGESERSYNHTNEPTPADIDIDLKFNAKDLSTPVFSSAQSTSSTPSVLSSEDNKTKTDESKAQSTSPVNKETTPSTTTSTSIPTIGPPCWSGIVKYVEVIPQLHLKAHHLHGPEMFSQLPSILSLDGRVELKKLFEYLTQIDLSSSRRRTAVLFTPDTTPSPSSSSTHLVNNDTSSASGSADNVSTYNLLYRHLKELGRGGVLKFEPQPNVDPEVFRELYIFPVCPKEYVPEFLRDDYLNNNTFSVNTLEGEHLFGVLLTKKPQGRTVPPTSPSNTSTSTTPLMNVLQNVSPTSTTAPNVATAIDPTTANVSALLNPWTAQSLASLLASVTSQTSTQPLVQNAMTATPTPSSSALSPAVSPGSISYGSGPVVGTFYQHYPPSTLNVPRTASNGIAAVPSAVNMGFQNPNPSFMTYGNTNQPYTPPYPSNLPSSYTPNVPPSYRPPSSHGRPY